MSIQEIEQAVSQLPRADFAKFERWFKDERNRMWDKQIETDSKSGALDYLLREVEEDVAKGNTRPSDELCDNP